MRTQYQGLRDVAVSPTVAVTAGGSITNTRAGTYYIYLIGRNRQGFNVASPGVAATITAGQQIEVTIPADIRRGGEDVQQVLILVSPDTDTPETAAIAAAFAGYEADEITQATLPATLTLSTDAHLDLSASVATSAQLPSTDLLNGMRREVADLGYIVEYNAIATAWERSYPNDFTPYINTSLGGFGANLDIRDISDTTIILTPTYGALGGAGTPVRYWIANDEDFAIPQGTRVTVRVNLDRDDVSELFSGAAALTLRFLGYVDMATGLLDTSSPEGGDMEGVNDDVDYRAGRFNLALQKDLPPNSAYLLEGNLNFRNYQIEGRALHGSTVSLFPTLSTTIGNYSPIGALLGDLIYPSEKANDNLRRIVPEYGLIVRALPGSGLVESQNFDCVPQQQAPGLAINQANQAAIITGNGSIYIQADNIIPATVARRALISTENGVGDASPYSSSTVVLDDNTLLSMTVQYPTAIRADYPDVIGGYTLGQFNATEIRIYVQPEGGGNIQQFSVPIAEDVASESFVIGGVAGATIGNSAPSSPSESFSLYEFETGNFTIGTSVGVSNFGASTANYNVAIAPYYENTVTQISHDVADGCIRELSDPLAELLDRVARALLPEEHAVLEGVSLHESKITSGFTGDAASATSSFIGQLMVKTDTTPEQLYRSTGTGAGGLKPVGAAAGGGSGGAVPLDYQYSSTTGADSAASGYFLEQADSARVSLHTSDVGTLDITAVLEVIPRRSIIIVQNEAGTKRKVFQTHSKTLVVPPPPGPTISSFTPTSGPALTEVIITGTNFTGATAVDFGLDGAEYFTVNSDTQITAAAPMAPGVNPITVTTPNGSTTSTQVFENSGGFA